MPSATGESWEKYQKNYADEEEPEKKTAPLSDEYVALYLVVDDGGYETGVAKRFI